MWIAYKMLAFADSSRPGEKAGEYAGRGIKDL